ncbi:UNVERIFIED_CONTAM: DDT domain-containing protein DDB [Sesamum latifolium]|uniref:DDT domain-containing protein DDB n=1 Tax=Sesamum latifolium TaxID=2727402 RepID=A0AAW2X7W7_9LAMI
MPLYKRKPFALVEKPEDLKPQELIFQIRFTKEIFRSYNEYLKRINLYRKRVWTCKATGKGNLTYEEALESEDKASKRIQNIPTQYIAPVLRDVQFSMLNLKDLVNSIAAKLQGPFSEGAELYGRKDGRLHLCKIIKVIEDANNRQYEIAWLDSDHKRSGKALVNGDELTGKNLPFSKRVLKSFIKDSTYRSIPWVLHDNLAKKHGISTAPPEELKIKVSMQNGIVVCNRKRKKTEETQNAVEASENKIKVYTRRNKLTSEPSLPGKSADEVVMVREERSGNGDGLWWLVNTNPEDQSIKYPLMTCWYALPRKIGF